MSQSISTFRRMIIGGSAIAWFLLVVLGLLGLAVVAALPWWMIAIIAAAGLLIGAVLFAARWLVKARDLAWSPRLSFAKLVVAGLLAVSGAVGLPVYYFAYLVDAGPTTIPLATLTNGKKTVVFQGMQHIGSEGFYKSVVFDLEKALADGYVLFYEGVQSVPGRPDLDTWFDRDFLGNTTDLSTGYSNLARACGLTFQLTYFEPLAASKRTNPEQHVIADVNNLDLKTEYDRLMREDPAFAAAIQAKKRARQDEKGPSTDAFSLILANIDRATPAQRHIIGTLCRGMLAGGGALGDGSDPNEKIILDFRNRALAKMIVEHPAQKIYITYGSKHFRGLIADLQKIDPAWQVVSLNWTRSMSNPATEVPPSGDWGKLLRW